MVTQFLLLHIFVNIITDDDRFNDMQSDPRNEFSMNEMETAIANSIVSASSVSSIYSSSSTSTLSDSCSSSDPYIPPSSSSIPFSPPSTMPALNKASVSPVEVLVNEAENDGDDDDDDDDDEGRALEEEREIDGNEPQPIIDMKVGLMTIITSEKLKGPIVINGVQQMFSYDSAPCPDGRGVKTSMFHSTFSLRVPLLYWYRCYGGMCTKFSAVVGNCMTECGNFLVCLLETRCPKPRYDAVIFLAETKQCCIAKDWQWMKRYKIAPGAELTVDMTEVQKYVILYLFTLYCNIYVCLFVVHLTI